MVRTGHRGGDPNDSIIIGEYANLKYLRPIMVVVVLLLVDLGFSAMQCRKIDTFKGRIYQCNINLKKEPGLDGNWGK